jgi:hypothetical protein
MTEWEKLERMAFVLGEIALGRCDNERPLAAETSRQMARTVLDMIGLGWPYGKPASQKMTEMLPSGRPGDSMMKINLISEVDAKKKWCPLARAVSINSEMPAAINRNGKQPDIDCMCIASECMAWRKVDQIGIGPNGEQRDRDMDGRTRWVDRGYCGAFGGPSLPSTERKSP